MHDLKDRREYANAGERCTGRQRPQPEAIDNLMHDRRNLRTLGDCLLFVCHLGHSRFGPDECPINTANMDLHCVLFPNENGNKRVICRAALHEGDG